MIKGFVKTNNKGIIIENKMTISRYTPIQYQILSYITMELSSSKEEKVSGEKVIKKLTNKETFNTYYKEFYKLLEDNIELSKYIIEDKEFFFIENVTSPIKSILYTDTDGFTISKKSFITKYNPLQYKILSLLLLKHSQNKSNKVSVMDIISPLIKNSETLQITYFKEVYTLLKKEKKLQDIIEETDIEIFNLDTEQKNKLMNKEEKDFIITGEDGNMRNLLFELLEKASKDMGFLFGNKFGLQTSRNMQMMQRFLKKVQPEVPFTEIETLYRVYITRIFNPGDKRTKKIKDIKQFMTFLEDYYLNGERKNLGIKMKAIEIYIKEAGLSVTPYNLGNKYQFFSIIALNIIDLIEDNNENLSKFEKLLKEFSKDYRTRGLSWNLKTVYNKLIEGKDYKKYLGEEYKKSSISVLQKNKSKLLNTNFEKEFADYMIKINEKNPKIQKKFYKIYKESGISGIENIL